MLCKYGDNVDTDVIIPARYLNAPDEKSLASHCMEDIDADFAATVEPGDIIVAGANFGCGSSREHAPLAIKACGVKCVIAASFARIFYRNAINIGFPIMECPEAAADIQAGDQVDVDFRHRRHHQPDHRQDLSRPRPSRNLSTASSRAAVWARRLVSQSERGWQNMKYQDCSLIRGDGIGPEVGAATAVSVMEGIVAEKFGHEL